MSILSTIDGPPLWAREVFNLGVNLVKQGSDAEVAYNLVGTLYLSKSGWILLSVPSALVRGIFSAMHEPGISLPENEDGGFTPHVSILRPSEIESIGGADKITERGKQFNYTLGRLFSLEPDNWSGVDKVWVCRVHSPMLQKFRRSYALSSLPNEGKYDFHITVAVRKKGVLGRNDKGKTT